MQTSYILIKINLTTNDYNKRYTVKSLANAHALINLDAKNCDFCKFFETIFGKILPSYKRPSAKNGGGGGKQIVSSVVCYRMRYI